MHATQPTEGHKHPDPLDALAIPDEVLRLRIRRLIQDPGPTPPWKRALNSPLFSILVTFALTGLVGTYLAYYYNGKQAELEYKRSLYLKDLESGRSFADELNKIKLTKIAEVWEKVYLYEASVEEVMRQVKVSSNAPLEGDVVLSEGQGLKAAYDQSKALRKEAIDALNRNRLWLEDDSYYKLKEYADIIFDYYFSAQSKQDFQAWEAKRAAARVSIGLIRDKMLRQ
ncbi:MAG TPA: hypothetical protein VF762_04935 [Blastocatellia bacterium]|jgi:hypothetical protein